jgi:hypothetical protein
MPYHGGSRDEEHCALCEAINMKIITTCSLLSVLSIFGLTQPERPSATNEAAARVDELIEQHLAKAGVTIPPAASDEIFVRRAYLDIAGRIPTNREADSFLASKEEDKRDQLVRELLDSPGFQSNSFNYWSDILRIKSNLALRTSGEPFIHWMKETLAKNTPYDQWVADLLTANGPGHAEGNGATGLLLRDRNMPEDSMSNTVRVFLGTRLECAQCHNHPFDKWTQRQYYEMVAFIGDIDYIFRAADFPEASHYKPILEEKMEEQGRAAKGAFRKLFEPVATGIKGSGTGLSKLPDDYQYDDAEPGDIVKAHTIFGTDPGLAPFIPPTDPALRRRMRRFKGEDPDSPKEIGSRDAFAEWLTSEETPRFTTVIANRMWKRAFGVGLIEPVDEIKDDSEAAIPALMTHLEELMRELDYDLRAFLTVLYSTEAYQRSSVIDHADFAFQAPMLKRMSAEQVWDSMLTLVIPDIDGTLIDPDSVALDVYRQFDDMLTMSEDEFEKELDSMILRYRDPQAYREAKQREKDSESSTRMPRVQALSQQLKRARKRGDAVSSERIIAELRDLGVEGARGRDRLRVNYVARASDLRSPAPDGHFLRDFGQSDRGQISASHQDANVPQILNLLNGFVEERLLNQTQAVLRREMIRSRFPVTQIETAYMGILSRKPTEKEMEMWLRSMRSDERQATQDLIWTLLNTHEFLFVR